MKFMIAMLAFVMMSQAQAQVVQQVPGDAVQALPAQTAQPVQQQPVQQQPVVQQGQPQPSGSPIYILNNQKFNGSVANDARSNSASGARQENTQDQPTTVLQGTQTTNSPSDSARRYRKDNESQTEDGIVQALEKARINDEIRRREKFNSALNADGTPVQQVQQVQQIQQQPVQQQVQPQNVIQVVPVVIPQQPVQVQEEVAAPTPAPTPVPTPVAAPAPVEVAPVVVEATPVPEKQYYVSGLVGLAKYPDVVNIRSNMAAGLAVGTNLQDRFGLEASFLYSSYELDEIFYAGYTGRTVDMTQYNLALAGKYNILTGRLRPYVGVVGAYVRRNYYDPYISGYNSDSFRNSNAFDAGGLVGLDFAVTEQFAIGFDFRYMTNVFYRQSTSYPGSYVNPRMINDVERLDYYTALVTGKFSF